MQNYKKKESFQYTLSILSKQETGAWSETIYNEYKYLVHNYLPIIKQNNAQVIN